MALVKFRIFRHGTKWHWQLLNTEPALMNGDRVIACALRGYASQKECEAAVDFLRNANMSKTKVEILS